MKTKNTEGDCYQANGTFVIDSVFMNPDANIVLCHGIVSGRGKLKGKRIGHAWCEQGNVVMDLSNNQTIILDKKRYYKFGKIEEKDIKRYTPKEAAKEMLKSGHFGPWD